IGGNCGFTIAPVVPQEADYLMRMLARVEGMPLESLEAGVPWGSWQTYGEWLDRLDGTIAVNAGFLVGHSALRRVVMGEGTGEAATDDQIARMVQLLHESLAAGGLGFSSSNAPTGTCSSCRRRITQPRRAPAWWPSPCPTSCASGSVSSPGSSSTPCRAGGRRWPCRPLRR